MTHTERLEPDLFAGIIELSLADAAASQNISLKPDISDHDDDKADGAFKTISETAKMLALPQHVLRFWESKFTQIKPLKLKGGRRYYRPQDIEVLFAIKHLLYKQGYTIKGARKAFSQFKRQKDQPMARSAPPKKPRKNLLEMDDTPLFSLLGSGNAPQSALVQAAMHSSSDLSGEAQRAKTEAAVQKNTAPVDAITVPVAAAAKTASAPAKPAAPKAAAAEAPTLRPMPLLESVPFVPVLEPEVQRAKVEAANAKNNEAFAQQTKRRDELKNIHSELLELRELLKGLPALTSA